MRIAVGLLCTTLLLAGCMHHAPKPASQTAPSAAAPAKPVVQPDLRAAGQVSMVNAGARFVVITFPGGPVPEKDQLLNVYRTGTKVGQVKVTGPQIENNTVADIVSGDVQLHDQVTE